MTHPYAESRNEPEKNGDKVLKVKHGIWLIHVDQKLKREEKNITLIE